jgi:hypothetical protein
MKLSQSSLLQFSPPFYLIYYLPIGELYFLDCLGDGIIGIALQRQMQ